MSANAAEFLAKGVVRGAISALGEPKQEATLERVFSNVLTKAMRAAAGAPVENGAAGIPGRGVGGSGSGGSGAGGGRSPTERLAGQTGGAFAAAFSRELARQIGPDGTGPLGVRLRALARESSASAVSGAQAQFPVLFPECAGPHREACRQRAIARFAGAAAQGASGAFIGSIRLWLLALAFLLGVIIALLVVVAVLALRRAGPAGSRAA